MCCRSIRGLAGAPINSSGKGKACPVSKPVQRLSLATSLPSELKGTALFAAIGGVMRLVTRGDLDGLTCAVIISTGEKIDDLLLVHPQDITDKRVEITKHDILANVPYHN